MESSATMDTDFVMRNQIVERYLGGRLPLKGTQDFEQFCRAHPELLEEIGLSQRLQTALRLMEAGGQPLPWEQPPTPWWQRPALLAGVAVLTVALAITSLVLSSRLSASVRAATQWRQRAAAQPLDAAGSTQTLRIEPSRTAPSARSLATVGGPRAQMADLKFDLSWSKFTSFQVSIDRVGQGRVASLRGLQKDSNGDLRIALNSSALGPGDYQFTLDGLNWQGSPVAQAWARLSVIH